MRDLREKEWFWIDNALVDREDLEPMERLIYMVLARFTNNETGDCFPGEDLLCSATGIKDKRTIRKYINNLEKKGLIFVRRVNGKSNLYHLKNVKPVTNNDTSSCKKPVTNNDTGKNETSNISCNEPVTFHAKTSSIECHSNKTITRLNKIDSFTSNLDKKDQQVEEEEKTINQSGEFAKNLNEYKQLVAEATGLDRFRVDNVIMPVNMAKVDLRTLLDKIKQSKFLQGKGDTKPNINNFSTSKMINRILADAYKDKQEETPRKNHIYKTEIWEAQEAGL